MSSYIGASGDFSVVFPVDLQLSVQQSGPAGRLWLFELLFLGVAERRPLCCSATTQILHFCTCFLDNWHFNGQLWLLTVWPWPALHLLLKKKNVCFTRWLIECFCSWKSPVNHCQFMAICSEELRELFPREGDRRGKEKKTNQAACCLVFITRHPEDKGGRKCFYSCLRQHNSRWLLQPRDIKTHTWLQYSQFL